MATTATGAWADSSAASSTSTGILAAVGLQAATGKSTLATGAGAIEAGLLTSGAIDRAGSLISRIVDGVRTTDANVARPVLVLAHDGVLDLMAAQIVEARIASLDAAIRLAPCTAPTPAVPAPPQPAAPPVGGPRAPLIPHGTSLAASDIVGALATDVSINPITLSFDDRMIVNAVVAHSHDPRAAGSAAAPWAVADETTTAAITAKAAAPSGYVIPGEAVGIDGAATPVFGAYKALLADSSIKRVCAETQTATLVTAIDALNTALNTATSGPTPLEIAMQLEMLSKNGPPWVLRLAIEQVGGSAVTKSNIWYTLGFPGAIQVSAGLLVSYRLVDPRDGSTRSVGLVRCAVPPTNFADVKDTVAKTSKSGVTVGEDLAVCSYTARP